MHLLRPIFAGFGFLRVSTRHLGATNHDYRVPDARVIRRHTGIRLATQTLSLICGSPSALVDHVLPLLVDRTNGLVVTVVPLEFGHDGGSMIEMSQLGLDRLYICDTPVTPC